MESQFLTICKCYVNNILYLCIVVYLYIYCNSKSMTDVRNSIMLECQDDQCLHQVCVTGASSYNDVLFFLAKKGTS